MGWASGSGLACEVWAVVREHLPAEKRQECAEKIYQMFCAEDADDWSYDDDLLKDAGILPVDDDYPEDEMAEEVL